MGGKDNPQPLKGSLIVQATPRSVLRRRKREPSPQDSAGHWRHRTSSQTKRRRLTVFAFLYTLVDVLIGRWFLPYLIPNHRNRRPGRNAGCYSAGSGWNRSRLWAPGK